MPHSHQCINGSVYMAKGFMIFLEGGEAPKKVHRTVDSAYREIHRISKLYPDRIVTLYHLAKRIKNGVSIGSHFPDDSPPGMINVTELVTHDKLRDWKPNNTPKNPPLKLTRK